MIGPIPYKLGCSTSIRYELIQKGDLVTAGRFARERRIAVSLMPFLNIPDIYSTFDNIVVELVPYRQGRKLGAWEFGERMKVQAVYGDIETVRYKGAYGEAEETQGKGRIGHCEVSVRTNREKNVRGSGRKG